jgi:hypothetical protein
MSHISFSELKNWSRCAYYHKLTYIDKIRLFQGNEFTAFGTAVHDVCEKLLLNEDINPEEYFLSRFREELKNLPEDLEIKKKLAVDMKTQGENLFPHIMPGIDDYFGDYEVVSTEEPIMLPIDEFSDKDYKFKGFIDLVLKTKDGRFHVIDWKTCSWGWDARKKADPMVIYQLIYYKHYYAKKHDIDPDMIDVHFGLLKRTAKKNHVELFKITSGKKRTENAIKLLLEALYNINNKNYVKNKLSCGSCEFYKTQHCT